MSKYCFLGTGASRLEVHAGEDHGQFLDVIRGDPKQYLRLGRKDVPFGWCLSCANKVLHGGPFREKRTYFFRHHRKLYSNPAELDALEGCPYYEPAAGRAAKKQELPSPQVDLVKRFLRDHAFGIMMVARRALIGANLSLGCDAFLDEVERILGTKAILSFTGFSRRLLPYYVLSKFRESGSFFNNEISLTSRFLRPRSAFPTSQFDYLNFSLLKRYRERNLMGITLCNGAAPNIVTLKEFSISTDDPKYEAQVARYTSWGMALLSRSSSLTSLPPKLVAWRRIAKRAFSL